MSSCSSRTLAYQNFYAHLHKYHVSWQDMEPSDYFLIILVDARHLDYTQGRKFFESVAKHPSDGSKGGDVGHAWIYLQGECQGKIFSIEGGHSGEIELNPVRYFDGIMNLNDYGYANPTANEMASPCYEPNPIKYLWTQREDGFFQKGSGGHRPTFAAKVSLTKEQFERILYFIHPSRYSYKNYALFGQQCATFVTQVAALAGLYLNTQTTFRVDCSVFFRRAQIRLWTDPYYSTISFATPDLVEKSLMAAIENGTAEYALDWYFKHCQRGNRKNKEKSIE